jgi:hypothetical protein
MVFGGAAMVSASVACGDSSVPLYGAPAPTNTTTGTTPPAPLYGAPPPPEDAGNDVTVAPLYGAPADSGTPDASNDGGGVSDGGRDGSPAPLYGLPPPQ